MEKYDEFIGEALRKSKSVLEFKEGDFVICLTNFQEINNAKDKIAEIIKIDNDPPQRDEDGTIHYGYNRGIIVYTLRFTEPINIPIHVRKRNYYGYYVDKIEIEKSDTLTLLNSQMRLPFVELIPRKYVEGLKKGEITKYIASSIFSSILKSIDFKIKSDYTEATYFDIDREKDNMISYMPINKLKEIGKDDKSKKAPVQYDEYGNVVSDDTLMYKSRLRQQAKVGRILRMLNPDLSDAQIETFVASYRAAWTAKMENLANRLRVVTGEEIQYWYLSTRYAKGGGTLNQSCMQGDGAQSQIKFYAQNPDSIALVILVDDDEKLVARALIWRCYEPSGVIFMDRIYSVKPEHAKMLANFAKENGIKTKAEGFNNSHRLKVHVNPYSGAYPYLDTFRPEGKTTMST